MNKHDSIKINQPTTEHNTEKLPSALTFFVNTKQRRMLINALAAFSTDRSQAILIALGVVENK
ncbi:MAG: hypothetical protein JKX70_09855 [Phycisphaerales bacterium]|nr:hypothetical protein [Phycisphaerales bacterium]